MVILSLLKCNGVVIKTQDYRENDKLVWLYTDNLGKVYNNELPDINNDICPF